MIFNRIGNIAIFMSMLGFMMNSGFGQRQVITLNNPSFEDFPQHSKPPRGWTSCGFYDESPPDVQPSGAWGVFWPAMDGDTYLGMVTRENETYESVGQKLNDELKAGTCYQVSFFLCKSPVYFSGVNQRSDGVKQLLPERNFVTPIKLRIWGGNELCVKEELLGESPLVTNTEWEKYYVKLSPKKKNYSIIFLEAYYETPVLFPYNGNILVDNTSDIVSLGNCNEEVKKEQFVPSPVVAIEDPIEKVDREQMLYLIRANIKNVPDRNKVYLAVNDYPVKSFKYDNQSGEFSAFIRLSPGRNRIKLIGSNASGTDTDSTFVRTIDPFAAVAVVPEPDPIVAKKSAAEKTLNTSQYKLRSVTGSNEIKRGDIINLENIQFEANSSILNKRDTKQLDDLLNFMVDYPQVVIEVGGHTNSLPDGDICMKISKERAASVARYLVENGISFKRIKAVGYGKRYPVASNETAEGRRMNQRVEVKIVETGL